MILFANKEDFKKSILIRNLVDIEHLEPYEEVAIRRKINPFIPTDVIEEIKNDPQLYSLLKKAVAHYIMPIAIPLIKVTLNNAGVSQLKDGELNNAKWWDVRDMALQCAKIADEALTDLIDKLLLTELKQRLTFLEKFNNIIFKSPDELFEISQIKGGYDVFMRLIPNIEHIWISILKTQLPECVFENIENNKYLFDLVKKATAYYSLADATKSGGFVFTSSGIFIQWEQLPWQKSAVLSVDQLRNLSEQYYKKGNSFVEIIFRYLKANKALYPCLENLNKNLREPIPRKSGLYF